MGKILSVQHVEDEKILFLQGQ